MNTKINAPFDVTRTTLAVLFISMLIFASFWLVRPFLSPFIWATTIVVATWPLLLGLQRRLWGKRGLAVAVMTAVLLLVFVVPFSLAVVTIVGKADEIVGWVKSLAAFTVPAPPQWLASLPLVGAELADRWQQIAALSPEDLSARLAPYAGRVVRWFVSQAGSAGMIILQFLLTLIIAAILYANGDTAASGVRVFARRLAGQKGEETAVLAAKAIRGVALGVALTAIIQSFLGGIGLAVTGVPAAAVLTAVMFILGVAQLGPGLVLIPSVILLYWRGDTLWGTVLLVWSVPVAVLDNFLRPALIRKGADLPLLLIFAGVVGGLIAFGIIGLFIGPVVLAVAYTLLKAWVSAAEEKREPVNVDKE
ncbi:MAG: AI-2E family transporter YdiK [Desulfobacterales bacterium]|nr:MAG: AI-2E family transporter YdiK [Desulfobacterales bacterium]